MTLPKKKRGFRSIVVNGETFNWNVDEYIDIRSGMFPETKLHVKAEEIHSWLKLEQNLIITPKLVSEAIQFALQHGWDPNTKTNTVFQIQYLQSSFYYDQKFT